MSNPVSLMPHAVCWRADPHLIWTMVVANAITALSYACICITLLVMAWRTRRALGREWIYFLVGFALFIVACGSTHVMEVVTTWLPWFWVDATTNVVTALLSAWVALRLIGRAPAISYSVNDYATRLQNTEHEKQQMLDSLLYAQKLEEWSRMSAVVAHEIANPLEAVQNLLFLIRGSEGVPPEVVEFAHNASEEADRVLSISRSTLGFFRQGKEPETLDLFAAAESVRLLLDTLLMQCKVQLELASTGNTTIEALPGEPRQVLLNLIRNACEASPRPGSTVHVLLRGAPDGVEVQVCDQGTGIPPEFLPSLFHFGVTTKGSLGNGMGLWAVQQILLKHGGQITVESTLGQGTTFTLWWPRTYTAPQPPPPIPNP